MSHADLPIHGTVYGVLLNSAAEWQASEALMTQPPYGAPPRAPVLYIKTANTWSADGADIALPPGVDTVEVGATLGVVMSERGALRGFVLLNDVSLPHSVDAQGFYRPPMKSKCRTITSDKLDLLICSYASEGAPLFRVEN